MVLASNYRPAWTSESSIQQPYPFAQAVSRTVSLRAEFIDGRRRRYDVTLRHVVACSRDRSLGARRDESPASAPAPESKSLVKKTTRGTAASVWLKSFPSSTATAAATHKEDCIMMCPNQRARPAILPAAPPNLTYITSVPSAAGGDFCCLARNTPPSLDLSLLTISDECVPPPATCVSS